MGSTSSTPLPSTSKDVPDFSSQLAVMGMMGFPFIATPFVPVVTPEFFTNPLLTAQTTTPVLPQGTSNPHLMPAQIISVFCCICSLEIKQIKWIATFF